MVKIDKKWCCFHLRWCHLGDEIGVVLILRFQPKILWKIQKICGDKIFRNSAFFWMYEGSYKIDSRLFITHFLVLGGFKEFRTYFLYIFAKKTSEKYFTKRFWKMLSKCISQMYSSECIFQVYLSRYRTVFWGQKSLGFGVNTKRVVMMSGSSLKGSLWCWCL